MKKETEKRPGSKWQAPPGQEATVTHKYSDCPVKKSTPDSWPPDLAPHHREQLKASGITPEVASARGYRTIKAHEAFHYGFNKTQSRSGLLIPIYPPQETQPALYRLRPDKPRTKKDGKPIKYEQPRGTPLRIDVPPLLQDKVQDPSAPLIITEGEKKADSLCTAILQEGKRFAAIDLPGVWGFVARNAFGDVTFSNDLRLIPLKDRTVFIVFDSDVMQKPQVWKALQTLTDLLSRKGAKAYWIQLPAQPGQKVGVDDYLVQGHPLADLLALARGPELERKPAPPTVELLEEEPAIMRTFAFIHEGRAYVATLLPVRITIREKTVNGKVVTLHKPETRVTKELFIVRDDGVLFGPGKPDQRTLYSLDELPFGVDLPKDLPPLGLLDRQGIREIGKHDPKETFGEIRELVGTYMDFSRSLGSQTAVEELLTAWIFSTYLTPGLSTSSYLWIYGVPGAGKSKLLEIIAALAYQARIVSAHSTPAALRDIASLGGTLCWDEAEALTSQKARVDPEKQGILLAGLRRQTAWATLREPVGKRGWTTVNVGVFCPKAFSCTRVPPEPLLSRCIVVPLVRSSDKTKTQKQPRGRNWEAKVARLRRALWDWCLHNLARVGDVEDWVTESESQLLGRALDPWIAPLVAAKLLEDAGVQGLYDRVRNLALAYQGEELTAPDLTTYVIAAIAVLNYESGVTDVNGVNGVKLLSASEVEEKVRELLEADDQDPDWVSARKVGRRLAKLRLHKTKTAKGERKWIIDRSTLQNLLSTYPQAYRLFQDFVQLNATNDRNATFQDQNDASENHPQNPSPTLHTQKLNDLNGRNATSSDQKQVPEFHLMPPTENLNDRNATFAVGKGASGPNVVVCPHCGTEVPIISKQVVACPECGYKLDLNPSQNRIGRCVGCGEKRELNELSLCTDCEMKRLSRGSP